MFIFLFLLCPEFFKLRNSKYDHHFIECFLSQNGNKCFKYIVLGGGVVNLQVLLCDI